MRVLDQLNMVGAKIGESKIEFLDRTVRLVQATANQLSDSIILLSSLTEIRKPQIMNDFLIHDDIEYDDKK